MIALAIVSRCLPWLGRRADNAHVALRRIVPGDAAALQSFVMALSPASRRLRFHAALNEIPETTLRALTCVDQREHAAFVLTVTENGAERIIGEARYAVCNERDTAEFGIAVADAFRGLGLADQLLAKLLDAARAGGLRWLVGDVLSDNARMLAFTRRCGFVASTRGAARGLVRVERRVDAALPAAPWAYTAWRARTALRSARASRPSRRRSLHDMLAQCRLDLLG